MGAKTEIPGSPLCCSVETNCHQNHQVTEPSACLLTSPLLACCCCRAAEEGQAQVLLALLAAGADPTTQTPQGLTPADLAAAKGHSQAVAMLAG